VIALPSALPRFCRERLPAACCASAWRGGGCSGLQYKYDVVGAQEDDDLVIEKLGATVLIDAISLQYMGGSEIDFVDDLIGQAFQINNPHAVAGCGCGTSFTI
jgi:iron-sulfur cluster assembly accessory protein